LRLPLIPLAKALKIDRAIRTNVYAYAFFGMYVSRFRFLLPHEPEFQAFAILPSRKRLFLDIGAHDGISARSFRVFDRTTPILSIEANPCHEPQLKRTRQALRLFDYKLIAAGEQRGSMLLYTPVFRGFPLTAFTSVNRIESESRVCLHMPKAAGKLTFVETAVPVIPLDDLALTPDFVKIDVEGHEVPVLRGMLGTIERWMPTFMIEFFPGSTEGIVTTLRPFGYRPFVFDRHAGGFRPYVEGAPDAKEPYAGDNLFYLPPDQQQCLPIVT
jgi:FkbM family methyltransferase